MFFILAIDGSQCGSGLSCISFGAVDCCLMSLCVLCVVCVCVSCDVWCHNAFVIQLLHHHYSAMFCLLWSVWRSIVCRVCVCACWACRWVSVVIREISVETSQNQLFCTQFLIITVSSYITLLLSDLMNPMWPDISLTEGSIKQELVLVLVLLDCWCKLSYIETCPVI